MNPDRLIEALVEDLTPVRPAASWPLSLLTWSLASWPIVGIAILLAGPLRPGALAALGASPRETIEPVLGVLAGLTTVLAGLELGVPGRLRTGWLIGPAGLLLAGWVALLASGLSDPLGSTAMLGKRPSCELQVLAFSLPPLSLGLWALKRRALFHRAAAGALVGLGSALIPAIWMQLACMQDPLHELTHHAAPILLMGAAGALAARALLPTG